MNLRTTVSRLTITTPPRNYLNPDALNRTAKFIKNKFTGYGLSTFEQDHKVHDIGYKNIVAAWGEDHLPTLVIGAHYDVHEDLPGADDNASGIAGLIELARLIAEHKPSLKYRIELVAYTLEEPPFFGTRNMGSYIHALSHDEKNSRLLGMVSLEMIGYFSESDNSQKYPAPLMDLFYPNKGNFIGIISDFSSSSLADHFAEHMTSTSINTEKLSAPSFISGIDFSDHRNYWEFGYQAIMITDTAFFRNPNYHKPTDTIDTLDFGKMSEVVRGVYWSILNFEP